VDAALEVELDGDDVRDVRRMRGQGRAARRVELERAAVEADGDLRGLLAHDALPCDASADGAALPVVLEQDLRFRGRTRHVDPLPRAGELLALGVHGAGDELVRVQAGAEIDLARPRRAVERGHRRAVEAQLDLRDGAVDVELDGLKAGAETEEEREEGDGGCGRAREEPPRSR
jgi:hypothetical protein